MKNIIYIPGVWDTLHSGHIAILKRAKNLGGTLIVGLPTDELVYKDKGYYPTITLKDRILMLESLKYVDIVVPYEELNFLPHLKMFNVDILVVGGDWGKEERHMNAENHMKQQNKKIIQFPYSKDISSTNIKNKIINEWKQIWENTGNSDTDDFEVVGGFGGLKAYGAKQISDYINDKFHINSSTTVLDYGCGSGVVLQNLNGIKYGIDISESMVKRAIENVPNAIFSCSDTIPYRFRFDVIFSNGVIHYLSSLKEVTKLVNIMKLLSNKILILGIPDLAKKEERENQRILLGKKNYPKQLYFDKQFFIDLGFKVYDDEIKLNNYDNCSFTAEYII